MLTTSISDLRNLDSESFSASLGLRNLQPVEIDNLISAFTSYHGRTPSEDEAVPFQDWIILPMVNPAWAIFLLAATTDSSETKLITQELTLRAYRRVKHLIPEEVREICLLAVEEAEKYRQEPTPEVGQAADAAQRRAFWAVVGLDNVPTVSDEAAWAASCAALTAAVLGRIGLWDHNYCFFPNAFDAIYSAKKAGDSSLDESFKADLFELCGVSLP
jgi:hypothetical protein